LFFKNGEKQEYTGGRTKDAIVSWILKKSGPASTKSDCDAIKAKVEASKFVLAYFGEESDALFTEAHIKTAEAEEKIQFVHSNDKACADEFGAAMPGEVFFRKFETETNVYAGVADKDSLSAWFKPLMVPTLFKFTEDEIEAVFGQQQNALILFRTAEDESADWVKIY
jgi:protein disulfide-isomerase A1